MYLKLKDDVDLKWFFKKYKFKKFNGNNHCYVKDFKTTDEYGGYYDELRFHVDSRQLVFMNFNTDYDESYKFLYEIHDLVEISEV